MVRPLRILHCFRAPVGGLFRHVCDLAVEQSRLGHKVGLLCDSSTGGEQAQAVLDRLGPYAELGVRRVPMSRQLGPRDVGAFLATVRYANESEFDVLHGHGAKGGAFARLAAWRLKGSGSGVRAFYTPHGGSLHYSRASLAGSVFLSLEQRLAPLTDGMIFESQYSSAVYDEKLGAPDCERRIIPNGLSENEFYVSNPTEDAADFLYIGELRDLKGVHIFVEALATVRKERDVKAIVVGGGPDAERFKNLADALGLNGSVTFPGPMPAREAFKLGRCMVVPSLAESFPYVVLEAAAARKPLIATNVGGIPEILRDSGTEMVPPSDALALAQRMRSFLDGSEPFDDLATVLQTRVRSNFTVQTMTKDVVRFYGEKYAA